MSRCPECGAERVDGSPCPRCLLGLGLEPPTEITSSDAPEAGESEAPGAVLGRYTLVSQIGEGGFGTVFLAEQREPVRRQVALKLLKAGMDTRQVIARFEQERHALAMMDHPHIARVLDAGATERGRPYFVMELVTGDPITLYCDRRRSPIAERLELFLQVCRAVEHAHQKGIIHRDIKPSNVLASTRDGKPHAQVIDFGIAKATGGELAAATLFTQQGQLIGTPQYMSPEQIEGSADVDTRTDVYSLGVLLYELLTGVAPFEATVLHASSRREMERIVREVDPPRPSTRVQKTDSVVWAAEHRQVEPHRLRALLRDDLDWIVMKALEKERDRRYDSPAQLAADIERHLQHRPVVAGPPTTWYRARKYARRHRVLVGTAAATLVALLAFATTMAVQARRIARERDRATRVSQFLVDLFQVSDPDEARGDTITAREVMDRGAARIERELAGEPEVQAELMTTLGLVYESLGQYPTAERLFRRALDLHTRLAGPEDAATLAARNGLAVTLFRQQRFDDAERVARDVLRARRRRLGPEHEDTLRSTMTLANIILATGRAREAQGLLQPVLDARRRALGPEHRDTIEVMNGLAGTFWWEGRHAQAEQLYREALEASRRTLGPDHPGTLALTRNLANLYMDLEDYARAEPLHRLALQQRLRVLGPEHPLTLASQANLGTTLLGLGRLEEAEQLHAQALRGRLRVLPRGHRAIGISWYCLARISARRGRASEALERLRSALAAGWSELDQLQVEPDLRSLRGNPEFVALTEAASR